MSMELERLLGDCADCEVSFRKSFGGLCVNARGKGSIRIDSNLSSRINSHEDQILAWMDGPRQARCVECGHFAHCSGVCRVSDTLLKREKAPNPPPGIGSFRPSGSLLTPYVKVTNCN